MTTIQLQISNFCNLSCPSCARQSRRDGGEKVSDTFLDLGLMQRSFVPGEWPSMNRVLIWGSIDDPTMHPQLIPIIKHWLSINDTLEIRVSTNGSTRTENFYSRLGGLSLESNHRLRIMFAVDGLEDTNHIYRVGSDWNKVRSNWRAYIAAGGSAIWQFVVFPHNQHQLESIRSLHVEEGFDRLVVRYSGRPHVDTDVNVTSLDDHRENATVICKAMRGHETAPDATRLSPELFVNHLGDVTPCCYIDPSNILVRDRYRKILDGLGGDAACNLKAASMDRIIDGPWFDWLHDNLQTNGECVTHCKHNHVDRLVRQPWNPKARPAAT